MAAMASPTRPATPHWTLVAITAPEEREVDDAFDAEDADGPPRGWPIPNVGPLEESVGAEDAATEDPLVLGDVGLVDPFKQLDSAPGSTANVTV